MCPGIIVTRDRSSSSVGNDWRKGRSMPEGMGIGISNVLFHDSSLYLPAGERSRT